MEFSGPVRQSNTLDGYSRNGLNYVMNRRHPGVHYRNNAHRGVLRDGSLERRTDASQIESECLQGVSWS